MTTKSLHPSGPAKIRAFRCSPWHLAALDRYARRRKISRGAALRELIEKFAATLDRAPRGT
jgi:hypothetical protein